MWMSTGAAREGEPVGAQAFCRANPFSSGTTVDLPDAARAWLREMVLFQNFILKIP